MSDSSSGQTPRDRWQRVEKILVRVLEAPPAERAAAVAEACAGDAELRREVESLLRADAEAGSFLEPPSGVDQDEGTSDQHQPAKPCFPPGTLVADRYRVEAHLGDGGMGAVHRARDLVLDTDVAIKVLDARFLLGPGRMEAFRREVRLARLVTHPNVCRVHDIVEDGAQAFITMEYVEGESLAERLRRTADLPLAWCLGVLRDVARGLAAAHAAGVIHRDLKPANVLLRQGSDRAVVADFGIAAQTASPGLAAAERAGTRGYMSPEQAAGAAVDARSDLYSLGVLAYRMVTGRLPGDPPAEAIGLPPEIAGLVSACLQHDPRARPADAEAALRLLEGSGHRLPSRRRLAWAVVGLATVTASVIEWRSRRAASSPVVPGIVVEAPDLSALDPAESWLGDAFRRVIINDLADGWKVEAQAGAEAPASPGSRVRMRLWRDAAGRLRAALTLPQRWRTRTREVQGSSLREISEAAARRIAEDLVPPSARHPTPAELQEVGAHDPEAWRQFRRARRAARMQQVEQVRELARDAVTRDPGFPMAWLELALTYHDADQARYEPLDKAVEAGDRAPGLSPFSRLTVDVARSWRKDDGAGMARALEAIGRLKLEGDDLLYFKTRQTMMADGEETLALTEWIAEKWPQDAAAPKQLADHYLGAIDTVSVPLALRYGRRAVALAPEDVAVRANLARALMLAGDEAGARAHLRLIDAADPEEKQNAFVGKFNNRLFVLRMTLGDVEDAAADARRLIVGPGIRHAQGELSLAALELSRGAFAGGLERLAAAGAESEGLHLDALAGLVYWEHAWQAFGLGRCGEAISSSARVRRLHASSGRLPALDASSAVVESLCRLQPGPPSRTLAAAAAARQQVAAVPAEGVWLRWRGYYELLIRYRLEDWAGVVAAYRDLESRSVPLPMTYYAASAQERLGRRDEAARLYELLATHPNGWHQPYRRGQAWLRLGILRGQAGDREGAVRAFDSLLRLWDQAPRDTPEIREAERRLAAQSRGK